MAIVRLKGLDDPEEERMLRHGTHGVVGDSCRGCAADPGMVREQRVESAIAAIVEVYIHATEMSKHEVSDRVGSLDRMSIFVEGIKKPWIFRGNELARLCVRPQLRPVSDTPRYSYESPVREA